MTTDHVQYPAPVLAGFEALHFVLRELRADPAVALALRGAETVNAALRRLLDLKPELELLPLELLVAELPPLAGTSAPSV